MSNKWPGHTRGRAGTQAQGATSTDIWAPPVVAFLSMLVTLRKLSAQSNDQYPCTQASLSSAHLRTRSFATWKLRWRSSTELMCIHVKRPSGLRLGCRASVIGLPPKKSSSWCVVHLPIVLPPGFSGERKPPNKLGATPRSMRFTDQMCGFSAEGVHAVCWMGIPERSRARLPPVYDTGANCEPLSTPASSSSAGRLKSTWPSALRGKQSPQTTTSMGAAEKGWTARTKSLARIGDRNGAPVEPSPSASEPASQFTKTFRVAGNCSRSSGGAAAQSKAPAARIAKPANAKAALRDMITNGGAVGCCEVSKKVDAPEGKYIWREKFLGGYPKLQNATVREMWVRAPHLEGGGGGGGGGARRGFVAASSWSRGHVSVEGEFCRGPPDELVTGCLISLGPIGPSSVGPSFCHFLVPYSDLG